MAIAHERINSFENVQQFCHVPDAPREFQTEVHDLCIYMAK